jgi:hypothetical protein
MNTVRFDAPGPITLFIHRENQGGNNDQEQWLYLLRCELAWGMAGIFPDSQSIKNHTGQFTVSPVRCICVI